MIKWLFETDVFDENLERFKLAVTESGGEFSVIKYDNNNSVFGNLVKHYITNDNDVVFYGSLELAAKIRKDTNWKVFSTVENYRCTKYYPVFNNHLLNSDYICTPFRNLSDKIFKYFDANVCFARPCSSEKCFDGQLLGKVALDNQLSLMSQDTPEDEVVFLSSLKRVEKEWRLVVTDEVITGSQYKDNGLIEFGEMPPRVEDFGNKVLNSVNYRPDKIWTLDICEFEGKLYVLEIGGLSCAGLYSCDISKIVEEINLIMEKV